jgi:hypothetical protein
MCATALLINNIKSNFLASVSTACIVFGTELEPDSFFVTGPVRPVAFGSPTGKNQADRALLKNVNGDR